ncbi:MAG: D-glycerate dehydrogenase, partial [Pseudomonadota bacterium]
MSAKRLKVIVTRRLPDPVEIRLKELFDTTLNESGAPMSQDALAEAVQTADVLVPTVTDQIDGRV